MLLWQSHWSGPGLLCSEVLGLHDWGVVACGVLIRVVVVPANHKNATQVARHMEPAFSPLPHQPHFKVGHGKISVDYEMTEIATTLHALGIRDTIQSRSWTCSSWNSNGSCGAISHLINS